MVLATKYRCPVCRKPLTKKEFERALGILESRDAHRKHELDELRSRLRNARTEAKSARREGIQTERVRVRRLLEGKAHEIQRLKERIQQLRRGSTPQTEGLEFEDKLAARLQHEFPRDVIKLTGKRGDILHSVRSGGKTAGVIIYECKREPRIERSHVRQAQRAKRLCKADFAILLTTGRKRGLRGLQ